MKPRVLTFILFAVSFFFMLTAAFTLAAEFDHTHAKFNGVLERFCKDGLVNYAELQNDPKDLRDYLDLIAEVERHEFDSWTKEEQLAMLINLYNAKVLALVIEYYPIDSIKNIWFPWKRKGVWLFGRKISLDRLEHRKIRAEFEEPRVHFAMISTAVGGAKLRDEAYVGENLDEQLEEQTKEFINDETKNKVSYYKHQIHISKVFKWFKKDFTAKGGTVLDYMRPYLDEKTQSRIGNGKYEQMYSEYDWRLNDQFLFPQGQG